MKFVVIIIIMLVLLFIPIIPYEIEVNKGVVTIEYQPLIEYITEHYSR